MNFTELNTLPWNEWMQLARQGETRATLRLCESAEPIISQFSRVPYFVSLLGKEEIRSIATLALLEFFTGYSDHTPDEEMPKLLKYVVKCALMNSTRWKRTRNRREQNNSRDREQDQNETEMTIIDGEERETRRASRATEPERAVLQTELAKAMEEALQCLTLREQAVIRCVYFRQRTMTEAAREMNCTPQAVWNLQRKALYKLRRRLKKHRHLLTDEAA